MRALRGAGIEAGIAAEPCTFHPSPMAGGGRPASQAVVANRTGGGRQSVFRES